MPYYIERFKECSSSLYNDKHGGQPLMYTFYVKFLLPVAFGLWVYV